MIRPRGFLAHASARNPKVAGVTAWRLAFGPSVACALVTALSISGSRDVDAQVRTEVPDDLACPRCSIRASVQLTLIGARGIEISSAVQAVREDQDGRFWVLAGEDPPLLFGRDGKFIGPVGRRGSGPGEYVRPRDMAIVGRDSVLVLDGGAARFVLLSRDLKLGRTISVEGLPAPFMVENWPSRVVGSGAMSSPAGAGWPLHILNLSGHTAAVTSSFGPDDGELRAGDYWRMSQVLGPARPDGFWVADESQYRLTRWAWSAQRTETIRRQPEWFRGVSRRAIGTPGTPPEPAVSALHQDAEELLWVFIRVPAETWRDAWPRSARAGGEIEYRQLNLDLLFDTMVEVLDPRSRRVVARSRIDEWVVSALGGHRIVSVVTDQNGVTALRVQHLELSGR